jgi:hydroxymethylpyrimidine/phosphomethylpyrimidine kinase
MLNSYAGPVVLDPVLASSSGRELLDTEGRAALLECLLPRAALITPNLPELALLSGQSTSEEGARFLLEKGARAVLVKGGHAEGPEAEDFLVAPQGTQRFSLPRRGFPEQVALTRGTGCRLSSFLAARLAQGDALAEAVASAKRWLWERLGEKVSRLGSGEAGYL